MDWEREFTVDDRETRLVETAQIVARLQALLIEDLEWFDAGQVFTAQAAENPPPGGPLPLVRARGPVG